MPNLISGSAEGGPSNCYRHCDVNDEVPNDFRASRDINNIGTSRNKRDVTAVDIQWHLSDEPAAHTSYSATVSSVAH